MIKLGISGATGRMGQAILDELNNFAGELSVHALYSTASDSCSLEQLCSSDLILDFSSPEQLRALLNAAPKHKCAIMVGTTGLNDEDFTHLHALAKTHTILYAANTSYGIFVMSELSKLLAKLLPAEYDIEILDKHHIHKKDAPSGTALWLEQQLQLGAKNDKNYPISSMRLGGIPGEHQVIAASEHETLSISHSLLGGRKALAYGAIKAGLWLKAQRPGKLYSIQDMQNHAAK